VWHGARDDGDDSDANDHDDDDLVPHQQRLISLYCRHATTLGVPQEPHQIVRRFPFYLELALYKYAVIVQGVAALAPPHFQWICHCSSPKSN
jgi:hypothetical protein